MASRATASRPAWSDVLQRSLLEFAGAAMFPRLARALRWPTRVGPRGFALYTAFNTLLLFAVRTWVFPVLTRMSADRQRARQELHAQLGREPSDAEVLAHLGIPSAR